MALYIHGPLRCKDLLGRIPNPHSRPALVAPQHAPGPRSDARSQRTPPGEIMHRSAAPHPAAAPATERPAPPAHLRSDRRRHPGHTQHTPTQPRSDTQPPTLEAVQHPQPHTIRPPDSTKARPTIKPDRLFLLHDGTGHRPARVAATPTPPGIRSKAQRKAHGKAFFQEQGTNKAHSGCFAPLVKQKSPRFTPRFQRPIVGLSLVRSRELESLAL